MTVPGRRRGPRSEMYLRRRASRRPLRGPARRPRRGCASRPRPSNVAVVPMMSGMSAALTAQMTSDARPASQKGTASPVARTPGAGPIPNHSAEYGGEHRERRRNGDGDEGVRGLAGGRSTGCMNTHAQTRNPYLRRQRLRAVQLQQARRWRRRESSGPCCASYDLRQPTSLSVCQHTVCQHTVCLSQRSGLRNSVSDRSQLRSGR